MPPFKKTVELGPNHKALWHKRFIATFADAVMLFVASFLLFYLASLSPIGDKARYYRNEMTLIEDEAKIDTGYGYKVVVQKGEEGGYYLHYDEVNNEYYIVKDTEYPSIEIKEAYAAIIKENSKYSDLYFSYSIHNYITIFVCGFIAEAIFLFVIPLVNKKRATVGQLLCGLQLISTKRVNKAAWYQLLGRLFFIFFIESVIPFLIIGIWIVLAVPVITVVVRFFNDENRSAYDFISFTKLIESATFTPREDDEETEDKPDDSVSKETEKDSKSE